MAVEIRLEITAHRHFLWLRKIITWKVSWWRNCDVYVLAVEILISEGGNVNLQTVNAGLTPLLMAAKKGGKRLLYSGNE